MHQDFEQSHDPIVFKANAGHPLALESAWLGQRFQNGVVDFYIQVFGLRVSEAIIDRLEFFSHLGQVLQRFFLAKVLEVV